MAKIEIGDQSKMYFANQADTQYHLADGDIINTGDTKGIDATVSVSGRSFLIDGRIENSGYGMMIGVTESPVVATSVTVGSTGVISSSATGIFASATEAEITNNGTITVTGAEVEGIQTIGSSNHVVNNGAVSAYYGISMTGDDTSVVNTGTIVASGGVNLATETGESARLHNSGEINAAVKYAVSGGGGSDTVVNTGTITGNILLGAGDDTLRNKGMISGTISASDGYDRIFTNSSFSLGDTGFEEAHLTGKANLALTGNMYGTGLYGNAGNNKIIGGEGGDVIDGGRGNDRLTGGIFGGEPDAGDTFAFKSHSGRDVITDFTDSWDSIRLRDYRGIEDFDDLAGHIKQSGDDTVISLLDGDRIVLRDFDMHLLSKDDFIF